MVVAFKEMYTGSPCLTTSHLVTVQNYDGPTKLLIVCFQSSDNCISSWRHDCIWDAWQLACIYSRLYFDSCWFLAVLSLDLFI